MTWNDYQKLLQRHPLPTPRIVHSMVNGAKPLLEEPYAGNLHVRFCGVLPVGVRK